MRSPERLLILLLALSASGLAAAQGWKALVSPAPLSPGHKELEDRCDKCHLVFDGVPNEKCLACHEALQEKIASGSGFHAGVKRQSCQTCHVDHQGEGGAHTSREALAAFNHDDTLFRLQGEHKAAKCTACHQKPIAEVSTACITCHDDSHDGELGRFACGQCHNAKGWNKDLKRVGDHETPTSGGHQGLGCKDCHQGGRQLAPALLAKPTRCATCHTSENHGPVSISCEQCHQVSGFKPAEHSHEGCTCQFPGKHQTFECLGCHKNFDFSGTPKRCSGCHAKERTHEALGECSRCHTALDWQDNRFDHNGKRSKFLLENLHLEVACTQCHGKKDRRGRTQFRGAPTDCKGCHAEIGEFVHGDFGDCAQCHTTAGFDGGGFDHFARTGFPLSGQHAKTSCQDCHADKVEGYPGAEGAPAEGAGEPAKKSGRLLRPVRAVPVVRTASLRWWLPAHLLHAAQEPVTTTESAQHALPPDADKSVACAHCHEDQHDGQVGQRCADCHTTARWTPSTFGVERHATAAFALDGKHTEVSCTLCHTSGKLKGIPQACAGCHVDVHRGKLGQSCQECHTTSGFRPVKSFEHARTGFELTVQHEEVACADCHGAQREKDLSHVKDHLSCQECHTAGHASFDLECVACHLPDDTKLGLASGTGGRVDHRDTGFPLQRMHAVLSCKSCHAKGEPSPTPRCASCHVSTHGGGASRACTMCHQSDRWSLVRFNHDRAGWTLRGRHFTTPCTSCHVNQSWVGLRTECFDCHALDAARARNTVGGHGFDRTDCRDCHRSVWQW